MSKTFGKTLPAGPKRAGGFTIIELFVTIIVAAILVALAAPTFRDTAMRNNVSGLNNQLIQALNMARAEAVRRGVPVEVVSVSGGSSWSQGWIVNADTAGNGTFATTLTQQGAVPTKYTVCAASTGGGTASTVVFTNQGLLGGGATSFDINVNRPDANAKLGQRLNVAGSGRVQSQTNTTGSPAPTSC
ncbi:MAG TPA: GspH/FimT family pseudopilin [Rudaea sp.]|nr:GspH/FimT family pseudopilin [Rudaea sp.]